MTHDDTDDTDSTDARARTLGEIDHTNPHTGEPFGGTTSFERGRIVVVDGGASGGREADETDDPEIDDGRGALRDVDHTPPGEADGANNVYERGNEGHADVGEDA